MSRKDYEMIALAFAYGDDIDDTGETRWVRSAIAETIANGLAVDNPRFDRGRFLKACRL